MDSIFKRLLELTQAGKIEWEPEQDYWITKIGYSYYHLLVNGERLEYFRSKGVTGATIYFKPKDPVEIPHDDFTKPLIEFLQSSKPYIPSEIVQIHQELDTLG